MKKYENFCPVRDILSRVCDKWSILIMYHLQTEQVMRFNQLQRAIPDLSQKMLTQTLRKLQTMNLISREVYPEVPPRVEYQLTDLGCSFMQRLQPMIEWAIENREQCVK
ncbi:MAG: helix-turn-helix transcriptional regulator [Alistipes sp.]|nr:helix-turn-helix transcriptional regulator [Alistipes sp.]MBR2628256.1 helix-turn-helix transcriptional regulator [Alistipes sp.]